MLELKIQCDTAEDARIYLNAHQYHNLLDDLRNALRNAQKHGSDSDVIRVVQNFFPDITAACDNHQGPY
jgi:nitrate/nitrite-specific signal transduction histidine kinase